MSEPSQIVVDEETVQELRTAKELLGRIYVLTRNARNYDQHNSAMIEAASGAKCLTDRLLERCDVVRFDIVSDCIFFNGTRLRTDVSNLNTFRYMIEESRSRGIKSIIFEDATEVDDLLGFAVAFAQTGPSCAHPYKEIVRLLQLEGVAGIHVLECQGDPDAFVQNSTLRDRTKEQAKHAFFSAFHLVRQAMKDGISKGTVNPRKVKRVVEAVVDSLLCDEESMLTLTYMKNYDEYTYQHSLNVCIYSIALANRLGLPKQALSEIGVASLFHDIGKTDTPKAVLNKVEILTDDDWDQIRRHTKSGVRILSQLRKMDRTVLRALVVAFCHHMNLDRSGYPIPQRSIRPDVCSRIVRIADVYDAITSNRPYRIKPFTRSEALNIIADKSDKELDPVLCRVFADVVGLVPDNVEEELTAMVAETP
jgi:putative nucleotidyltransferase with HDIG domain